VSRVRYVCLGYQEEGRWERMPAAARQRFVEECLAYDRGLRERGHFVRGEALQGARTAATLRPGAAGPAVTDGPYAETKEQLGGILVLEARDLNEAIQLMSQHPSLRLGGGVWEIRPSDESFEARYPERRNDG